jgi:hypothetical protein
MNEYSAAAGHSFGYRPVDNPGTREDLANLILERSERGTWSEASSAADAIINNGWESPDRQVR